MKILFVHKQILFPRDTGGKIRVLNILQHLAKRHSVTYVCNLRAGEEKYLPQMRALGLKVEAVPGEAARRGGIPFYTGVAANVLSTRPFSVNRNYDPAVRKKVAAELETGNYDLLICDCPQMALHTVGLNDIPSILFQHNVEAQILKRHAEVGHGRLRRWYMHGEWRKMQRFERECGGQFDAVIAVSELDRQTFQRDYGWNHVQVIDTAVDTEFFQPDGKVKETESVVFVGSMDWLPNQDGVKFFAREVWPQIRQRNAAATFRIVGRNPSAEVRSLGNQPGIEVVGSVPDVRPYLSEAAVVVVPLLVGGGTRLKIFEAMAMGRAVVSTTIGAEGLPLTSGEHFIRADEPQQFAEAVSNLLADGSHRAKIGRSAESLVRSRFGSETVASQFESICLSVSEGLGTGSRGASVLAS